MGEKQTGRQKSTVQRMPPLTKTDKTIYIAVLALLLLVLGFTLPGLVMLQRWIAFRDPAVIAFSAGIDAVLPFLFCLAGLVILLLVWFLRRRPIFGDKAVRYGGYPWKAYMYPLFGPRHKMADGRPRHQRLYTALTLVLACIFLGTLLLAFRCVFSRACLKEDLTAVEYDSLNRPSEPVSAARDCDRLTVKAHAESNLRTFDYRYYYGVELSGKNGKTYTFYDDDFRLRQIGHSDCLRKMLSIKALFSADRVTSERRDLLPDVIAYNCLDEEQTALLQELFQGSDGGQAPAQENGEHRNAGKVLIILLCAVLLGIVVFLIARRGQDSSEAQHRRRERRRQRRKASYDRGKESRQRKKEKAAQQQARQSDERKP